jgi:hypothetical protein
MKKLRTGFSQLKEDELDNAAEKVHQTLTGNPNFPDTTPPLSQLASALSAYRAALAMPAGQTRTSTVAARRAALEGVLGTMASNLNLVPGVTEEKLATTGFEFRKESVRTGAEVDGPQDVRVKPSGVTGELEVRCKPVERARSYQVQYTTNAQSGPWADGRVYTSTRGIKISGLERGKDYWVRVRAIGANGEGPWSDPATAMVT